MDTLLHDIMSKTAQLMDTSAQTRNTKNNKNKTNKWIHSPAAGPWLTRTGSELSCQAHDAQTPQ